MAVWTIAWWTQAETARVAQAIRGALLDWGQQWGVDAAALRVAPRPGNALAEDVARWRCVTGGGDRDGVWVTHPATVGPDLGTVLCGGEQDPSTVARHGGPLSLAAGHLAARALAVSLCGHFDWPAADDTPCGLPAGLGRGALSLSISLGGSGMTVVLAAGVARAVAGRVMDAPAAPLVELQSVLGRRKVTLGVALRPIQLEIGSLCSLELGDVVALDHKLDESVTVYAQDATPVAVAHLARIGPYKAIRLERAA